MSLNKLRWKSRKGIRELDILLQNYLDTHYSSLDSLGKKLFEEILEIDTYDLLNAISGNLVTMKSMRVLSRNYPNYPH